MYKICPQKGGVVRPPRPPHPISYAPEQISIFNIYFSFSLNIFIKITDKGTGLPSTSGRIPLTSGSYDLLNMEYHKTKTRCEKGASNSTNISHQG